MTINKDLDVTKPFTITAEAERPASDYLIFDQLIPTLPHVALQHTENSATRNFLSQAHQHFARSRATATMPPKGERSEFAAFSRLPLTVPLARLLPAKVVEAS